MKSALTGQGHPAGSLHLHRPTTEHRQEPQENRRLPHLCTPGTRVPPSNAYLTPSAGAKSPEATLPSTSLPVSDNTSGHLR